jgi:hypothetical protein
MPPHLIRAGLRLQVLLQAAHLRAGRQAMEHGGAGTCLQRLVPTDPLQRAVSAVPPHQWMEQAIRMVHRLIGCAPFGAKPAVIEGKTSRGSTPTTFPAATLRYMPHSPPQ